MLPLCSGILAEAIIIASSCLQQIQSISLSSLLQCPHFRSSCLELFCKKSVLKNFAKFTDVSSGTGVSCEFSNILKNTFFCRTSPVTASGICTNQDFYSNTVCNKSAAEAWICLVSFYGKAKECMFLRIVTFFIKTYMWHRILSISFTGSKLNCWKTIIQFITASNNSRNMLIIYVIDLSTKNKM